MKLLQRLGRPRGYPPAGRAYEQSLSTPFHHLITVLLSRALEESADAICMGFRTDMTESPEPEDARRKSAEEFSSWLAAQRLIHPSHAVVDKNAMTRGPIGTMGVPIYFRNAGIIRHFSNQPFHTYGTLLGAIEARLVALGASEVAPQPLRYIEIGYGMSKHPATSGNSGKRRFLEVDLEFQKDNTFWIYIRGVREATSEVRVSQTIF